METGTIKHAFTARRVLCNYSIMKDWPYCLRHTWVAYKTSIESIFTRTTSTKCATFRYQLYETSYSGSVL